MNAFQPNDETLIGFLLGALEPAEHLQVEESIARDPAIKERLLELRKLFAILEEDQEQFEPNGDLVARTMNSLPEFHPQSEENIPDASVLPNLSSGSTSLEPSQLAGSWMDVAVLALSAVVILCLLLPSLLSSRELARRGECSNNMRMLAEAILSYADQSPNREIPSIDLAGPLSFAGIYAVRLKDSNLLEDDRLVWCPSIWAGARLSSFVPNSVQIRNASDQDLIRYKKTAGGSYAFNLGILQDQKYVTPKLRGGGTFAILGDSAFVGSTSTAAMVHGGAGLNILFDDGHVGHVRIVDESRWIDDPYLNRVHRQAPGLDLDDSALAPSHLSPVANRRD